MPNESDYPEGGRPEEVIEATAEMKQPSPEDVPPPNGQHPPEAVLQTEAAFLVYLDQQGHWVADDNIKRPVQVARNSTFIDFHNAATTIAKDIAVQETASRTVALQQQMAVQMAEQMQTRQIAESIGGPVGGGLKVPGRR